MGTRRQILDLKGVHKTYKLRSGAQVKAVAGVDLTIWQGETVALVGESGSGKSTLGRMALLLEQPDEGAVFFDESDVGPADQNRWKTMRREIQPIFQDSSASFNPRRNVRQILTQALKYSGQGNKVTDSYLVELLEGVKLKPGASFLDRRPSEMSGGQRQRLNICRAFATQPRLIVADEPLSGADVSTRGHILNIFLDLQSGSNLSTLFITHDLTIAQSFADRVYVMHKGHIVESGTANDVIGNPSHAYTKMLKEAVPALV